MPGQGRKRANEDVAPVIEGELVPSTLEEMDEPSGREGADELDDDAAVEMAEDADEEDEDDEEEDEDEDDEDEDEDDEEEEGTDDGVPEER